MASNKVNSLAREASRLTEQERAQSDEINQFVKAGQQADPDRTDLTDMMKRRQELDRLATERQQLSNDLSSLEKNLRDTARATAPNEPDVAKKLRDALTEMDETDLDNHIQRTADWLRSGINPNSNGTENQIAQSLEKLSQQLQQAQQGMGKGKPGQRATTLGDETAALDQVERLRSQIEAMAASRGGNGRNGQNAQGRQGQNERAQDGRAQNRQPQNEQGGGQQPGGGDRPGAAGQQTGQNGWGGQPSGELGQRADNRMNGLSGDVRTGGAGGVDGAVWNNINTGNNRYGAPGQQQATTNASAYPGDTERGYEQGMRELSQLRHMIQGNPQAAKEAAELARQMQHLDPSRFPGNPAMVEQMHREVLSAVDRLEFQLQHDGASSGARTGKPYAVPAGYQDSVAEYFRRLSMNP
jgi:hypothetical protein